MFSKLDFQLRAWLPSDIHALCKYADNVNIAKFLTNTFPNPYTKESGEWYISEANKHLDTKCIKAIVINNEVVGSIGAFMQADIFCKNAELGYWLAEPFWGKGIMTNAIQQFTNDVFLNYSIHRIFARPFHTNIPSQKVLEKCGFTLEAKLEKTIIKNNELLDEWIYSLRK